MKEKQLLSNVCGKSKAFLKRSSPTILTCVSVIGVVATSVMTAKGAIKASELLESERDYRRESFNNDEYLKFVTIEPISKLDTLKIVWACYAPAVLVGLSTIACIVGINSLNKRNQASLTSAYAMLSESYQRYRNAAKTVYGEDADSKIKAQMAKETYIHADGYAIYSSDLDHLSEKILCYDLFSKRYFEATMASVLNAQYHVNRNFCLGDDVSVNDFYEFLGIEGIENGDEIMWDMEEMTTGGIMWLDFENRHVVMDDGMECCVISALWDPNKFNV